MGFKVTRIPSAGLETQFLESQTRGSRGKDRACGALVSNVNIYFFLNLPLPQLFNKSYSLYMFEN